MRHTSEQFARQAESDLAHAQAIALAHASGDALGTAMFLAQQAMEKQFKSALLRVGEAVGAVLEEGLFKQTISHTVHQHPAEFYQKCLEGIRRPTSAWANRAAGRTMCMLGRVGNIWDPEFCNHGIRLLLFQYYLGMRMSPNDLRRLDSHLASIFKKIGGGNGSPELPRHKFSSPPKAEPMDGVMSDEALGGRGGWGGPRGKGGGGGGGGERLGDPRATGGRVGGGRGPPRGGAGGGGGGTRR